jgi:type IV pilus assembly protein PilQ
VKDFLRMSGAMAATITLVASAPALAADKMTQVTGVQLNPATKGMDIVLQTQAGSKPPQVFNTNRGNTWTALVFNTKLANNQPYRQNNPAPGIASIAVTAAGKDGVQVTVVGEGAAPKGQLVRKDGQGLVLNVVGAGGTGRLAQATAMPPMYPVAQAAPIAATPNTPIVPFIPSPTGPRTAPQPPRDIAPPLQSRAVAPPVGDMAISQIDASPTSIDLGTNERIPRLVLRDAPVREVLSLLARAAGMNLAYSESGGSGASGGAVPGAPGGGSSSGGPTISLDIENEAVQDVFNYVLRIACVPSSGGGGAGGGACSSLEANRVGRTIFVGTRLPDDARNTVSRTIRLNQADSTDASNFLTTQGAETQLSFTQVQIQSVGEGAAARVIQTNTPTILALRANEGVGPLLLRGLSVSADTRTNSITLTGTPRKIELATSLLTQLDVRKRQVSVSVKVIDIDLIGINRSGTSFSFGIGDVNVVNSGGMGIVNLGRSIPTAGAGSAIDQAIGLNPQSFTPGGSANLNNTWLGQLQAAITNQNAKILTDPTLVIQEGQTSKVELTEDVVSNIKVDVQAGQITTTVTAEKAAAGLTLEIIANRVDDNGFVTLGIKPTITAPLREEIVNMPAGGQIAQQRITLLKKRALTTGQIRMRDGQTLLLTGVIQETDRSNVRKLPILGDLPLLGTLFRRTERTNERREVIILVTPKILDDSDRSMFGYGYNPGKEAQQFISK